MNHHHNGLGAYLQTLYQHTYTRLPLAFGLLLVVSITEGIGLMLLLPLLASIGVDTDMTLQNPMVLTLKNAVVTLGLPPDLVTLLGIFFLLMLLRAIASYWRDIYLLKMQLEFVDTLRAQLHEAIGKAQWSFLVKQRSSDFSHTLTTDISRIGVGTYVFLQALVSLSVVGVYLLTSLYLSPLLTLLVMVAGGGLLWVFKGYHQRAMQLGKEQTTTGKAVLASVSEFLGGIKLVKSYGAETHYLNYFNQAAIAQRDKQLAFKRNSSLAQQGFQTGSALLLCLFFYVAIAILQIAVSQLLVLLLIFVRLMPLLSGLQRNYEQINHMLPAYAEAMRIKQQCEQATEIPTIIPSHFTLVQGMELRDVTFTYQSETPVLQEVNSLIPASQTTAIMGASGAGKSTLADLLAGLMLPDKGKVLIDGESLTEHNLLAWRNQVAYVPQEVFLFHDTLRANMLWVNPSADEAMLWEALELAAARAFVVQLPQQLDTVIGERGIRLSGGERQRIALARALLRKPTLLILDEATSALDHQNERTIKDSLKRLHGKMTIILIAHRLTTVESADQILMVQYHHVERMSPDSIISSAS